MIFDQTGGSERFMDFDIESLTRYGIDIYTGLDYTGGREGYISALQRFYKSSEKNKARIHSFMEAKDLENLEIVVHALKSNSKMIGALELSAGFEELEMAAKEKNMQAVLANIGHTLTKYSNILSVLEPLGVSETFKAPGEISADEAKDIADKILEALDNYDDELAAELIKKLAGYPFRITQRVRVEQAAELIDEFMYDEAAELIREIYPTIE